MNHGTVTPEIAQGLLVLNERLERANIPSSRLDETLNIATWNVREFGKKPRTDAAIHYIGEVMGRFDLIGLVELRDNLSDLKRVLDILGPYWRAVYSDMIPDAGGNRERVAYIYDKRAVIFNGLAAEANQPRAKRGTEYISDDSFWRAPYMASFRAGNFDFVVITTHIRWGDSEDAREKELKLLANWIHAKSQEENAEDKDILVMGDFNIPDRQSPLYAAMTSKGLKVPVALLADEFGSNLARDKRYDQIFHLTQYDQNFTNAGGVVDFYEGDHTPLFPGVTKSAFTYQMSDHLPLWIQINTDIDVMELNQLIRG